MVSDERLLEDHMDGHPGALEALIRRHWPPMYAYVLQLVGQAELAEEIMNDTFLKLHRSGHQLRERGSLRAFLYTIARRTALDALKSPSRVGRERSGLDASVVEAQPWRPAVEAADPEEALTGRQALEAMSAALDRLPEVQASAFVLFHCHDLSSQEVADALSLSPGTTRVYLSAARRQILAALAGGG